MKHLTAALILALSPLAAAAGETPYPGRVDPRIQSVEYDPDQVILLRGAIGSQMMLEFAPGERLENVAIGDSLGWQVTPNKRADLLFIKPIDMKSATNMTVVTNERRYVFELRVAPKRSAAATPYVVRFHYPRPVVAVVGPPAPEPPPQPVNTAYSITGAQSLRPSRIFDDGKKVYFQWPAATILPAVFSVGDDGGESLVNYVVRDGYIVVEQISPGFRLRSGKQLTTVINQAYISSPSASNLR